MDDPFLDTELQRLAALGHREFVDHIAELQLTPNPDCIATARALAQQIYAKPLQDQPVSFVGKTPVPPMELGPFAGPKAAIGFKGVVFHGAAAVENALRNATFHVRINSNEPGPRFYLDGDSWFCFPLVEPTDVAAHFADAHIAYSSARPADLFVDYAMPDRIANTSNMIGQYGLQALILSGGGNEMIGEDFNKHLRPDALGFSPGSVKSAALGVIATLEDMVAYLRPRHPKLKFVVHSYDWPLPRDPGGWLRGPLEAAGISPDKWNAIVASIIDIYADQLDALQSRYAGTVYHADLRGSGRRDAAHWHDEIHLNSAAAKVAAQRLAIVARKAVGDV